MFTNEQASNNILMFTREGRLIQGKWHGRARDGRELACLLGAIDPSITSAEECNAELMPIWLAELTVTLFDCIENKEITKIAMRYSELIRQWRRLDESAWRRILNQFLACMLDHAVNLAPDGCSKYESWAKVELACNQYKEALLRDDEKELAAATRVAQDAINTASDWAMSISMIRAITAVCLVIDNRLSLATRAGAVADAYAGCAVYLQMFNFLLDQIQLEIDAVD
jgi:hypothetical protein